MRKDKNAISLCARDFAAAAARKDDDAPYAASGQVYDLLALAAGYDEYEDCMRNGIDSVVTALDFAINGYDFERSFVSELNAASFDVDGAHDLMGRKWSDEEVAAAYDGARRDGLLLGAWYALNRPNRFAESLERWQKRTEATARAMYGDYHDGSLPDDLADALEMAHEAEEERLMDEFLHGDYNRANWRGVYREAGISLFHDDCALEANEPDRRENRVWLRLSDEMATDLVSEHEGSDEGEEPYVRPSPERVKEAAVRLILDKAAKTVDERRKAAERRSEERERQAERDRKVEERRKAKREEWLRSMTR